ncbi:MAG: hypothetical protein RIS43_553 [Actinomycetota bacterium]|jgi:hypothetical protein
MTSRVIVLPSLHGEAVADFAANLSFSLSPQEVHTIGSIDADLPEHEWVASVSLGISRTDKAFQSIHLVAIGEAASRLPAIAFAQQAARRRVLSYICINAIPQGQFADWPDAPVCFVTSVENSELFNLARLRGWQSIQTSHDELHQVAAEAIRNHTI